MTSREPPLRDELVEPPTPGSPNYDPEVHEIMRFYYRHERKVREQVIAWEEMREIADQIESCFLKNGVNGYQVCRPLLLEYRKRSHDWKDCVPPPGEETTSVVDNQWHQYSLPKRWE